MLAQHGKDLLDLIDLIHPDVNRVDLDVNRIDLDVNRIDLDVNRIDLTDDVRQSGAVRQGHK